MNNINYFAGKKLLLIGNSGVEHIGTHLNQAAKNLGLVVKFCNCLDAFGGPRWLSSFNWRLRGHRPNKLRNFSQKIIQTCLQFHPKWLIATGIVPIESWMLAAVKKMDILCFNYLTDDPWNLVHKAPWFIKTLRFYDTIFSPRKSNMEQLSKIGCPRVMYLPFAYATEYHFPEELKEGAEKDNFDCDIVFIGGADSDRAYYISGLITNGFKINLYGNYWERYPQFRKYYRGYADPRTLRLAIKGAKIALCLVRKANRDGHSMRTFEIPAIGACMLTEDTKEHREIFGKEWETVVYFKTIDELIEKVKLLLEDETERSGLAYNSHNLIIKGSHAYKDRLISILAA